MAKTRRTYTPEFKAEAVKLVTEQGYSLAKAASSLGICDLGAHVEKTDALFGSSAAHGSHPCSASR